MRRAVIVVAAAFLSACAVTGPARKAALPSEAGETHAPPDASAPAVPEDPFDRFPGKYRAAAKALERRGRLPKALFMWKVVHAFLPEDAEASGKIRSLEAAAREEAGRHVRQGREHLEEKSYEPARREFLLALACDPGHKEALGYLRDRLSPPDAAEYETREGDTLKGIAKQAYGDPDKAFVIAYFNDVGSEGEIRPGRTIRLPSLEPSKKASADAPNGALGRARDLYRKKQYGKAGALAAKILESDPTNREADETRNASYYQLGAIHLRRKEHRESLRALANVDKSYRDTRDLVASIEAGLREGERHYIRGSRHFLAQELEQAIREWETTLRLDPGHPRAKKDLEKARVLLDRIRKLP